MSHSKLKVLTSFSRSSDYGRAPEKKRIDDYPPKRDDYKRDTFKRPISDYSKRDIEPPRHSTNSFDGRSSNPMSSSSSSKDRYVSSDSRGAPASFSSSRSRDDRDGWVHSFVPAQAENREHSTKY